MSIPLSLGLFLLCLLALGHAEETLATSRDPDHGYMVPDRVPLPTLTTVGAIRQLAAEEARRGYPVRIRGVVTLNNPYISLMFVQDESGGIYVSPEKLPWLERTGLSQGMLVQIEGRTSFGRFSPTVRGKEDAAVVVKVLGRAPLPEPLRPSIVQLADPRYQNQWIEISGVVRQVTSGSLFEGAVESVAVTVVSPAGRVTAAAFRNPPTKNLPTELVGATVRVRGVFTAILNNNDQFLGMWLATAALNDFQIVGPSPGEAFALPVRPIASLMRFDVMHSVSERVRIQGTVTQTVAGRGMYVQGETAAVYVKTIEPPQVQPGCRVDVAGFPAQGEWNPILEDAVYQTRGSGPLPEPPAITTETALSGDFDCRRVVMEGLLLQASLNPEQPTLVLQSGEKAFLARLADASDLPRLAGLAEDSWLRLEGVCVNSRREDLLKQGPLKANVRPGTFYLLVASPDGVIVLRKPSWWTTPRILAAAGAVLLMALAALLWVIVLRYRVAVQTGIIRRQLARETVYEERGRIARELHDTLEQELAGISLQLDTVSAALPEAPDGPRQLLDLARLLLRHSRAEARRSIMDLRASLLEAGDLASALQDVAANARDAQSVAVEAVVEGPPRRLPGKIETNLLRIAQEALANALKHGKPSRVTLWLSFVEQGVELRIEDDGAGFDVEQAMALSAGHFGLLGMRERAERIHAAFKIQSARGKERPSRSRLTTTCRKGTRSEKARENPTALGGRSFHRSHRIDGRDPGRSRHDRGRRVWQRRTGHRTLPPTHARRNSHGLAAAGHERRASDGGHSRGVSPSPRGAPFRLRGRGRCLCAVQAGVAAYLPKSAERAELLAAIRTVHLGQTYFPPAIAARLAARQARPELSNRENEVLRWVVLGHTNREIAQQLGIAEVTVKLHVGSLLQKLGARDRTEASTLAIQRGIVHFE